MYAIVVTSRFKSDLKRVSRQNRPIDKLEILIDHIAARKPLPQKVRDHALIGNYAGYRECHIEPDWLLLYRMDEVKKIVILVRTGSHAELFG
ncbi:type II toxin-antitoxin system YafQ family toxin [Nitrosomonas oligotropha]|uniref:type II toxin-antitoxin system YafQ family toxin n=1 Tax=Nitrosomonas oligotropha TaxID=42354 RepID=UPI00136FDA6B|nr:type II toxin-antitoxin system YafQ family toxin [Nitrosomonas oligotropha]MXS84032.1 type II toxin-antitoxin system YafQ family toxin [Nitrosomonas oligotropha]